mgnify:CR=1 FL=1
MFCYQCQETAQGKGCTLKGVCGKTAEVAGLQDLLMYLMKGISKLTGNPSFLNLRLSDLEIG